MDHLRIRQKIKKRLYSRTVQIILLIILILLTRSTFNVYKRQQEARKTFEKTYQELVDLQNSHNLLEEKNKELESERGRDREIREKFDVVKEGEAVVVIVQGKDLTPTNTPQEETSIWNKIWSGFSGLFN